MLAIGAELPSDFTLIIPTHNRHALFSRLVHYYSKRLPSMHLLVLDSSDPSITEKNSKVVSPYGNCVQHVIFPITEQPFSKFARGVSLVKTPYVSFCGDDDIVFPDGLAESVSFLREHPDYVCAHGLYLNFREEGNNVHVKREYAGPSIEASHPGARIFQLFQNYESLFYAVFRTNALNEIYSGMADQTTSHYKELFQSVAALIKGKTKRFPKIYAARRDGPPVEAGREKWHTHYWFAQSPKEVLESYRTYCSALWHFYEAKSPAPRLDKEAFCKMMDLAHAVHFSAGCPPEYFYSVLQSHWPSDKFQKSINVDLFDQLKSPKQRDGFSVDRLIARIRRAVHIIRSAPGFARLNSAVRKHCRTPWRCRPHPSLWWLTTSSHFSETYLELCFYLDQA